MYKWDSSIMLFGVSILGSFDLHNNYIDNHFKHLTFNDRLMFE